MINKFRRLIFRKKETLETVEEVSLEKRLKHLENYFKLKSIEDESFIPEYEAAKRINFIVFKEKMSKDNLLEIVDIYNQTNKVFHYSGAMWLDLKILICSLLNENNVKFEHLENGEIEII